MKRRTFLQHSLGGLAGLALPVSALAYHNNSFQSHAYSRKPFALPPLDEGKWVNGKRVFNLTLQKGESKILDDTTTETIGINQAFLAPVLRFQKGDTVKMQVTNKLEEEAALHWHGMILPASEDGGPHQAMKPGKKWVAEWKVLNEPATYFYHSHTHNHTGEQVWKGLAGQMQIVDESQDKALNLPHEYGIDDYPIIIQDRQFEESGEFFYSNQRMHKMNGMHGDTILVNGAINSELKPGTTSVRLRLHNGSNARFYDLVFSDQRAFNIIGTDGGLLEKPITINRIRLAPAERAEIIVDLSDRKPLTLVNLRGYGNVSDSRNMTVMHFNSTQSKKVKPFKIQPLVTLPNWSDVAIAQTRPMNLEMHMGPQMMFTSGGFTINGEAMDMDVINEELKANTFEIWELKNNSGMLHPFHVHNTQFKILDKNGIQPHPWEQGLKDTVTVHDNEVVRILFPTGPYQNSEVPYMYHCHILEHEDAGMMGQFTTT